MRKKIPAVSFKLMIPPDKYMSLQATARDNGMALSAFIRNAAYNAERELNKQRVAA